MNEGVNWMRSRVLGWAMGPSLPVAARDLVRNNAMQQYLISYCGATSEAISYSLMAWNRKWDKYAPGDEKKQK